MANVDILITKVDQDLALPGYSNPGDAGADLMTTIDFELQPGERKLVPTGVSIALPRGYVGLIHPRSGLAAKRGITVVNAPGTIDAGYRGEIFVCLLNTDLTNTSSFKRGDRIAQIIIQKFETANFIEVTELPGAARGKQGFGSSGR